MSLRSLTLAAGAAVAIVPAQATKLPSPADNAKVVQVHDVRDAIASFAPLEDLAQARGWVDALRKFVEPPLAADEDLQLLAPGLLVVHGRPEQQGWIERAIRAAGRNERSMIELEARVLVATGAVCDARVVPLLRGESELLASGKGFAALPRAILDGAKATALFDDLRRAKSREVTAPRMITLPLQRAHLLVGEQISYIKDFEVEILTSKEVIADPVIGTLLDGVMIECSGVLLDTGRVGLALDYRWGDVLALRKFETSLAGSDEKLTLQLPQWKSLHLDTTVPLATGDTALYAFPEQDGERMLLFVRAHERKRDG